MSIKSRALALLHALASLRLAMSCLGLMMALIFIGTLAQASMGTFAAQAVYFNSFLIRTHVGSWLVPVFPGGLTIGLVFLINLTAAFAVRFHYRQRDTGILLIHFGMILLIAGQGLTQLCAKESRLVINEGETKNYVEATRTAELVFVMVSDPRQDQVISVPTALLARQKEIQSPYLPFTTRVMAYLPNAGVSMGEPNPHLPAITKGIGQRIAVQPLPETKKDDDINNASAILEIMDGEKSLGTWLASRALGAPQSFFVGGKEYKVLMRSRRTYLPFNVTLKDFKHDIYPGTEIPKNFSSLVHIKDAEGQDDRDVLIYMNHPLRTHGLTFFQASFGENDTLSILQVVRNPVWLTPYISCLLVLLGMAIQFLMHLSRFSRRRR